MPSGFVFTIYAKFASFLHFHISHNLHSGICKWLEIYPGLLYFLFVFPSLSNVTCRNRNDFYFWLATNITRQMAKYRFTRHSSFNTRWTCSDNDHLNYKARLCRVLAVLILPWLWVIELRMNCYRNWYLLLRVWPCTWRSSEQMIYNEVSKIGFLPWRIQIYFPQLYLGLHVQTYLLSQIASDIRVEQISIRIENSFDDYECV